MLINCPKCSNPISDKAEYCPNCGCSLKDADIEQKSKNQEPTEADIYQETYESFSYTNEYKVADNYDKNEKGNENDKKFYQRNWFVIVMLILFPPLGIFLMWKYRKFILPVQIILSVICGIPFLFWMLVFIVLIIPCDHEWEEATCTQPRTCWICEETEGEPLGHAWQEASCTQPKTCEVCGDTEGDILAHTEGDWTLTEEATLSDVGVEELLCTECGESLDSRGTERKNAKVEGKSFNFEDEEFIEWINDIGNITVESKDLELMGSSAGNTSFRIILSDGDKGAFIFHHSDSGNIDAIMVYFEEWTNASAVAAWVGEKIDADFSTDSASIPLANGKTYTSAGMSVSRLELDTDFEVSILAPTDFLLELLD